MSTNFFLKSITFQNYRGFKNLKIESLKRINIIGGRNGTGKTTLLEGLFFLLDYQTPYAVTRPYVWRKTQFGPSLIDQIFYQQDKAALVSITADTEIGIVESRIEHASAPTGISIQIPASPIHANDNTEQRTTTQPTLSQNKGLSISVTLKNEKVYSVFILGASNGLSVTPYLAAAVPSIPGIFISAPTRNSPQEDSERFSIISKSNQEEQLLQLISSIRKDITQIKILYENGIPTFYANISGTQLLPLALLGDGVQTAFSIGLAIMNCKNGMLFLDEFESAIHYSLLPDIWATIGRMATQYNCQIFAATHSLECIRAAAEGLGKTERAQDLQYIRLENRKGDIAAEVYSAAQLVRSLNGEWEIR